MKPLTHCPACNKALEPATLTPAHRWCNQCAIEFDKNNEPVVREGQPPPAPIRPPADTPAPAPVVRVVSSSPESSAPVIAADFERPIPIIAQEERKEEGLPPPAYSSMKYRVRIGGMFFICTGRTELENAHGDKIIIEPL